MLEMDLRVPNIARVAQITAAIPLIEHALHPSALAHLLLKEGAFLPFTGGLQDLKGCLGVQSQYV